MRHQYTEMNRNLCIGILVVLANSPARAVEPSRWSRQISSYTSDISDWVPLTKPIETIPEQPIKRQAVAQPRILTEPFPGFTKPTGFQENFQSGPFYQNQGNRPLYLQSVPSASQNYLTDQGFGQQSIRLALGTPQFPLSQGFVAPSYSFDNVQSRPDVNQRFPQLQQAALPNPVRFEPFQKPNVQSQFGSGNIPTPLAPQSQKPVLQSIPAPNRHESPKFIDGYRMENTSQDFIYKKRPQSLQKLKMESTPQFGSFNQRNEKVSEIFPTRSSRPTNVEREEVQLLYVPVDSLNRGQFSYKTVPSGQSLNRDLFSSPAVQRPDTIGQSFNSNNQRPYLQRPQQNFQTLNQELLNAQKFGPNLNQGSRLPSFGTSPASPFPALATTPKPKKLKPHQPPLAVFMAQESKKADNIKVADVLSTLKSARNIAVLDSVSPSNSPKVFIGPSSLSPPENYVKFELPYLSNLENTDRKLRQLPFFVAPLSYSTPEGFAKIPFPSPHVGSVIVNSLLKDSNSNPFATSTPFADVIPNSYTAETSGFQAEKQQALNSVTTKPTFSYFSTVPPKTPLPRDHYQSQFFSFEPQGVTSIQHREPELNLMTASPEIPQFFPSFDSNYNFPSQNFNFPNNVQEKEKSTIPPQGTTNSNNKNEQSFNKLPFDRPGSPAPPSTTQPPLSTSRVTSPKAPSTFPSHLLETHNPFSINQAFEFSSPVDYHNIYEENKKDVSPPSVASQTPRISKPVPELTTENENTQPSSPNYLQNYSPEIHYQTENLNSRFPSFDVSTYPSSSEAPVKSDAPSRPSSTADFSSEKINDYVTPDSNPEYVQTIKTFEPNEQNSGQRDNTGEISSTTSTTTRRPLKSRGRPRYTTTKADSQESNVRIESTRAPATRRPLRERRPLPSRNRFETSSKATTERPTSSRRQPDTASTTESSAHKTTRMRTRGRHHYKPTEHPDELHEISKKSKSKKDEDDIAYQRDILHQNYPVTLMERMSTVDIEAITSPSPRISSTRFLSREPSTENYSAEESFVTEQPTRLSTFDKSSIKEVDPPTYTSRTTNIQTDAPYVPKFIKTSTDEPIYHSRSSTKRYEDTTFESRPSSSRYEQDEYIPRSSTFQQRSETTEHSLVTTEPVRSSSYYSDFDLINKQNVQKEEESTTINNSFEISKLDSHVKIPENNILNEQPSIEDETHEINTIPATTTNYRNKPRHRPFPSRQHPASTSSTTEASSPATQKVARLEVKRRPVQPVTYRPAYDRRRTTMRIEEIESELKTKQIHSRPDEIPENRHPVYKPELITEPAPNTYTTEQTKKIIQYRRRKPQNNQSSSATTDTPVQTLKKSTYETKNRFRGRRPTTETSTVQKFQEEPIISTTSRSLPNNRYNHRARVPESRFNRKPTTTESPQVSGEESEQEADYSIHRPKIVPFDDKSSEDRAWSPDVSTNSFKPYNPNDIQQTVKSHSNDYSTKFNDTNSEQVDIITVRNDYDDILVSVTPASNKLNEKIPDMPPTLEALVEQSKSTPSGGDTISTIESVIEEMMKSLEEQDEDEYTRNVMKHEGGEIGEIPPERVISSGDTNTERRGQRLDEPVTDASSSQESPNRNQEILKDRRGKRRGYWKRVNVRPVTTESFEVAESQFYTNTVNHLGDEEKPARTILNKATNEPSPLPRSQTTTVNANDKSKDIEVTTVLLETNKEVEDQESKKIKNEEKIENPTIAHESAKKHLKSELQTTVPPQSPGDMDLGTGTPDPTIMEMIYEYSTQPTEPPTGDQDGLGGSILGDTKNFNGVMDYLFGFTIDGNKEEAEGTEDYLAVTRDIVSTNISETQKEVTQTEKSFATEVSNGETTTESLFVPSEISDSPITDEEKEAEALMAQQFESIKKMKEDTGSQSKLETVITEVSKEKTTQSSTESSFWDPASVVSTSMSTEISHETEICFRGKCIKTSKELK